PREERDERREDREPEAEQERHLAVELLEPLVAPDRGPAEGDRGESAEDQERDEEGDRQQDLLAEGEVPGAARLRPYALLREERRRREPEAERSLRADAHAVHALHAAGIDDLPEVADLRVDLDVRGADGGAVPALPARVVDDDPARGETVHDAEE